MFQPGLVYVSNYSLTSFTFKALSGQKILAESITIQEENKPINGGFPIGSGLIFTANEPGWFAIAKKRFMTMKKHEYERWLSEKTPG